MEETYLERIKHIKSAQKITNDKLSEMTGIPLGTLSKLLAGINDSPKLANMVAISQALGCSLDWLITGTPENTNNYTLTPEEMSLIENYRLLDAYGRTLTATVIEKERDRAAQQKAAEALTLHDMARGHTTRNTRARRRPYTAADLADTVSTQAHRYKPAASPMTTSAQPPDVTHTSQSIPLQAAMPEGGRPHGALHDTPAVSPTGARLLAQPSRAGNLPAGLRRRKIPMYDLPVSAGTGEFLSESSRTDILIPDSARTVEADYALRISGDSMEPRYHSGDILLVQTAESVTEGELGIFILDGAGYFKRYGGDRLISLNTAYVPILLKDFENVSCCGRVVGKLKRK